jgi:hypothetical protein
MNTPETLAIVLVIYGAIFVAHRIEQAARRAEWSALDR